MKMTWFALCALAALAAPAMAQAQNPCGGKASQHEVAFNPDHAEWGRTFCIGDPKKRDTVTFNSQAPLEDIVGTTNEIHGYLVFDPTQPEKGGVGRFLVPVASIDTGIPLRDEHLQGADWLDAGDHPTVDVEITGVSAVRPSKSGDGFETWDATLEGTITIKGVTKPMSFPARVSYLEENEKTRQRAPGDLVAGRTSFKVRIADFGIRGPKGMEVVGQKVSEEIEVEISFVASAAG